MSSHHAFQELVADHAPDATCCPVKLPVDDADRVTPPVLALVLGIGSEAELQQGRTEVLVPRGFAFLCVYFGLVRMVSFGSSKSLWVPSGAETRNDDSAPSANTRPTYTGTLPDVTA